MLAVCARMHMHAWCMHGCRHLAWIRCAYVNVHVHLLAHEYRIAIQPRIHIHLYTLFAELNAHMLLMVCVPVRAFT
jgi:hypothetical protein